MDRDNKGAYSIDAEETTRWLEIPVYNIPLIL